MEFTMAKEENSQKVIFKKPLIVTISGNIKLKMMRTIAIELETMTNQKLVLSMPSPTSLVNLREKTATCTIQILLKKIRE